jgi:transposase
MAHGEIVLGVDTHKDIHVAAIVDGVGRLLCTAEFQVSERGGRRMLAWARRYGTLRRAGVEGTGSYGYGLARQLEAAGVEVREVNRPNRSLRRLRGKSDPTDAEVAARAVLSGEASAVPKDRDGPVGQLRALMVARRGAVKARTQTSNQIKALLVTCEEAVRRRLQGRRDSELARCCGRLRSTDGTKTALRSLGRRWVHLDEEARALQAEITRIVCSVAPKLLLRPGVGVLSAAQLLITAGDNPDRLRSEAAFAALCGAAPVDASSGKTTRKRLSRGGDRSANAALWMIAHVRMVRDPRTRDYAARRMQRGNTRKEILRILKRYIARELFPIVLESLSPPACGSLFDIGASTRRSD